MILTSSDLSDEIDIGIKNNFNRKSEDFTQNTQDNRPYKVKEIMAIKKDTEGNNVVQIGRATGQQPSANQLTDKFMTLSLDDKQTKKAEPLEDEESNSVERCTISGQQSSTAQLTDMIMTLTLDTKKSKKAEPQEDDECPDDSNLLHSTPDATDKADLKEDDEDSKRCDSLVKLEAPKEENEDSEENETDDPDKLGDRGPTNGCASHYSQLQSDCDSYYIPAVPMPKTFPNYHDNYMENSYQGNKNKRSLDKMDFTEPYKFVKPQNNLSNPPLNVSVVNNVNQKQMSGGTVVTSPDVQEAEIPPCNFFNLNSSVVNSEYQSSDMVNLMLDDNLDYIFNHSNQRQQVPANQYDYSSPQTHGMNIYEKLCDDGYQSDNLQSPTPSPQEYHSSSPQTPMSHQSGDSGVCSPMSEDFLHAQVKSPGQSSYDTYRLKASPPHSLASPQYVMSPKQQVMVPSPPQQTFAHPTRLQNFQPEFLPSLLPNRFQQVDSSFSNISVQALQQSIELELENFHHPDVDDKLFDLQLALSVIGEDLTQELRNKAAQQAQSVPPPNIPTTVVSPVDDTERLPQVSSQVNRLEKTAQNSQVQKKPPPQVSSGPPHPALAQPFSQQPPKMPIPSLKKQAAAPQVVAVMNPTSFPVFVFQSPAQPRYKEIRPKEPSTSTKPVNNVSESSNGRSNGSPIQPTQQSPPPPPQPTQNQANKVSLITVARRIVAEMPTSELEKKDVDGDTVLHVTVCRPGCLDLVQALLERLVREQRDDLINAQNYMGQTPLYLAVSSNHPKVVKILIEKNADVNPFAECRLPSGVVEKSAAIHCASSRGEKYLPTLKELLKSPDINVDQFNSDGHTPLNCAILCHGKIDAEGNRIDSIPIIQALIEARANPNLQTQKSGKTSLMYALESRDIDLIEKIFQLVDPVMLPSYLKNNAFDGSTCQKIADSLRPNLSPADQSRLVNCMKPRIQRNV